MKLFFYFQAGIVNKPSAINSVIFYYYAGMFASDIAFNSEVRPNEERIRKITKVDSIFRKKYYR